MHMHTNICLYVCVHGKALRGDLPKKFYWNVVWSLRIVLSNPVLFTASRSLDCTSPWLWCWVFRKLVDYFVPRTYRSVRALSTYIHMYKHLNWYIHSMSVGIAMCMCACGEFGWKLPIAASCFSVVCCPFRPTVQYLFSCGCTCVRIISLTNCATFPIRKKEWLLQFSIWTLSNLNKRMCMC